MRNVLVSRKDGVIVAALSILMVHGICSAERGDTAKMQDLQLKASLRVKDTLERLVNDKKNFQLIKKIKTPHNTQISFLVHTNGKKYIVKQETRLVLSRHMTVIRDALGSLIAFELGIPANFVAIIPSDYSFPGKYSRLFPASLHEVVPGMQVNHLPQKYEAFKLSIKQCLSEARCRIRGLTREVITNMAFHPDLSRIAAFDTFIANGDRHAGNFFYDPATNHYYAIDLESSFKRDSARYACELVISMLKDKKCSLSDREVKGLVTYRDTLNRLILRFPPEVVYNHLIDLAVQGGFVLRSSVRRTLENHKLMIRKNYASCQTLIPLLNMLIKKHAARISGSRNAKTNA